MPGREGVKESRSLEQRAVQAHGNTDSESLPALLLSRRWGSEGRKRGPVCRKVFQASKRSLTWKLAIAVLVPVCVALALLHSSLIAWFPGAPQVPSALQPTLFSLFLFVAFATWLGGTLWMLPRSARKALPTREDLEERLRLQEMLWDINLSLGSTLELEALLPRMAERVGKAIDGASCSILLVEKETGSAVIRATWGRASTLWKVGTTLGLNEPWVLELCQAAKPLRSDDLRSDERFGAWKDSAGKRPALLALPLLRGDEFLAILLLVREGDEAAPAAFTPSEVTFATAVGQLSVNAIGNTLRYQQAVRLSITDPLTGVYNRRYLVSRLDFESLRAKQMDHPVSIGIIDIDHFKCLNDAAGHSAGDLVLRRIGELLMASVRRSDTIARIGGEEFCLLFPDMIKRDAIPVFEQIRRLVQETDFSSSGVPGGKVTISVGFSTWPEDGENMTELFDAADAALYASKRNGRNRVTAYEQGMELHPERQRDRAAAQQILDELASPR